MEIALSLSGGGYRAAVYHIGVLSYLDSVSDLQGGTLLDSVNILSSVSGGSLTALWYVYNRILKKDTTSSLKDLFSKIVSSDIEKELYVDFQNGAKEGNTLIMQLSKVYDKIFFNGLEYNTIIQAVSDKNFNIHHFSVCSTDFNNGRPFHFYASRDIYVNGNKIYKFKIGNSDSVINSRIAGNMLVSDIMAASSCFPGIFEPITFPDDFNFQNRTIVNALTGSPFSLMDGGIVDNQGIEGISKLDHQYWKNGGAIELIIVSDVAKAKPQKFVRSGIGVCDKNDDVSETLYKAFPWVWSHYKIVILLGTLIITGCGYVSFNSSGWMQLLSVFFIGAVLSLLFAFIYVRLSILPKLYKKAVNFVKEKFAKGLTFDFDESFIFHLKSNSVLDFFNNRFKSLTLMANDVMMGQIRKHKIRQAFAGGDDYRTIVNAIYALTSDGTWSQLDTKIPKFLRPSKNLKDIADNVANIDTKLCFTKKQIDENIPQMLVACGRFTTCWNLLLCINYLKGQQLNSLNPSQKQLLLLEQQVLHDWGEFQLNPFFKSIV